MKKYLILTKISFQENLVYRANFLFYFLRQTLEFFTRLLIWGVVFQDGKVISGYDFSKTFYYFLTVFLTGIFAYTPIDYVVGEIIKSGDLSGLLLRPINFFWALFFREWGKKGYRLIYVFTIILLLLFFGVIKLNCIEFLVLGMILTNAAMLIFLYRFLLGIFSFWLINITSIFWLFRQSAEFLGGSWLPLAFLPQQAVSILRFLPFYLTVGFPAEFFQGRLSPTIVFWNIIQQFGWIILLFWLVAILWKKGIREYEAVGG